MPNALENPSIEAISLSKKYDSLTALSNLNLRVEGPKCVGLLGPNGAGKTTTLKIFADLIGPSAGEALINGVNVLTHKKEALANVSTLIETPEIYPSLTPKEALMMIAEIRGIPSSERSKRIEEAVSEVRMEEWMDKRVGKFSKGMKQRICVASALLNEPAVILLDEPTMGLDPRGMSEVRDIVKSLKNKKRLIFMSSHILSEVADVCDEVAMIDHGKLIVHDTIANLTSKFSGGQNAVEVGFLHPVDESVVSKAIGAVAEIVSTERIDEKTLRIRFNGGLAVQEWILSELVKNHIGIVSYSPVSSALEDVYLKLTKSTL